MRIKGAKVLYLKPVSRGVVQDMDMRLRLNVHEDFNIEGIDKKRHIIQFSLDLFSSVHYKIGEVLQIR